MAIHTFVERSTALLKTSFYFRYMHMEKLSNQLVTDGITLINQYVAF